MIKFLKGVQEIKKTSRDSTGVDHLRPLALSFLFKLALFGLWWGDPNWQKMLLKCPIHFRFYLQQKTSKCLINFKIWLYSRTVNELCFFRLFEKSIIHKAFCIFSSQKFCWILITPGHNLIFHDSLVAVLLGVWGNHKKFKKVFWCFQQIFIYNFNKFQCIIQRVMFQEVYDHFSG